MAIKHSTIKATGDRGYASEWNAEHTIEESSKAKRSVTLIVAANDSKDKDKADYVCDGVNDQVEIIQAITDLPASGGCVKLLDGTFVLDDYQIYFTKDNISITGQGKGTIIKGNPAVLSGQALLESNSNEGTLIEKIFFDQTGSDIGGVFFDGVTKGIIQNCWFENGSEIAIGLFGSGNNNYVASNVLYSCRGIDVATSTNNVIAENLINNGTSYGIRVMLNSHYNIIIGNSIGGCNLDGVNLQQNADRNIITSNETISNNRGIYIQHNTCNNNIVVGNVAYNNTTAQITDSGTGTELAHNITT